MKTLRTILAATALALVCACDANKAIPASVDDTPVASRLELRDGMRRLWTEHVFWTRVYIVEALADLPDKDVTLTRLLKNQTDLGNAMKPYYGDAFGKHLTELLETHIKQAGDLVAAAKAGDTAKVASVSADWKANANEIANFLADSNPSLDRQALIDAMQMHLDTTVAEVTAQRSMDWAGSVAAYDTVQNHIITMADALTDGTATQYPKKVTEPTTSSSAQDLHFAMRELWHDHVAWTRLFIISDVAALPDLQATTERLLSNQTDIGNAIKPFYGEAAGNELTRLLREHIMGAVNVLHAAKTGNMAALQAATSAWIANADQISTFLSNANRFIDPAHLQADMHTHLMQTVTEASKRLAGDYQAEIDAYDAVELHILQLSDALSSAISQQRTAALEGGQ